MRADQILVATVSAGLGVLACLAATQRWQGPYRLRSIAAVQRRYGLPAARVLLLAIGLILLVLAFVIALDLRPAYRSQ
ncbi:hypothetical protein [Roseimaritima sediminicola]|uniref:hypothetical protein n=1 Tax=Roseimaritima sediminicola TaxID=2662066 RepID=UPI00129841E5|nr:hypothetical protein [Roseimaritima sediminicola]